MATKAQNKAKQIKMADLIVKAKEATESGFTREAIVLYKELIRDRVSSIALKADASLDAKNLPTYKLVNSITFLKRSGHELLESVKDSTLASVIEFNDEVRRIDAFGNAKKSTEASLNKLAKNGLRLFQDLSATSGKIKAKIKKLS